MKLCKKAMAAALAAVMCASAAGCSGADKSWAVKDSTTTIPIGAYVYNLYNSFGQADSKKADSSKSVLDQKVENKDAKTWINEKALSSTKQLLLVDRKMKEMKLTLTDAEKKTASDMNSAAWKQYSAGLEKYGIAQSSFELSYGDAFIKEKKIFDAIYDKGGSKAVSDDELKAYYMKNYTSFSYIVCDLYTKNAQGSFVASFSDAQKKEAEGIINGYADQIKTGKLTMRQAADDYKKVQASTTDELHTDSINLSTDSNYPDAIKNALKSMQTSEVKTLELSDQQVYLLLFRDDTAKGAETALASATDRSTLLLSYKSTDFLAGLQKEADAMTGVTLNNDAINSYDPKMFVSAS